jgi:hypothetical protein
MKNIHAVTVNYMPCTGIKSDRLKIHSLRHNTSVFISFDGSNGYSYEQAEKYLLNQGFTVVGVAENGNGYLLLVEEFHNIK